MFKEKFKNYRVERKMTQVEFAKFLGIARSSVGDVEKGRVNANIKLLNKLVACTGLGVEYWLDDEVVENIPVERYEDSPCGFIALQSILNVIIETKGYDPVTKDIYPSNLESLIAVMKEECKLKIMYHENTKNRED